MSKSYATMEQHICKVCGQPFDTGNILMDRRLKESFEFTTITDYSLCEEHQRLFDEGYIALVECDPAKSKIVGGGSKPQDVYRTGQLAHVRIEAAKRIFNIGFDSDCPIIFVEPGVIQKISEMVK